MSQYVTLTEFKRYLNITTTTDDTLLQETLDRAEHAVERYTRRQFVGTAGTVRFSRYDAHRVRQNAFWLADDLYRLVSITLGDGQIVPTGSVWLEPREGPPYHAIRLRSAYAYAWNTDDDLVIAGTFGYSLTAPRDIQQAVIRWAAYMYRQKDATSTEVIGMQDGATYQQERGMPEDVKWLLAPYRSRTGGAV